MYEKALLIELQELGLTVASQKKISVYYKHKLTQEVYAYNYGKHFWRHHLTPSDGILRLFTKK